MSDLGKDLKTLMGEPKEGSIISRVNLPPPQLPQDHEYRKALRPFFDALRTFADRLPEIAEGFDYERKQVLMDLRMQLEHTIHDAAAVADPLLGAHGPLGQESICYRCPESLSCPFAFDSINSDGECIANK